MKIEMTLHVEESARMPLDLILPTHPHLWPHGEIRLPSWFLLSIFWGCILSSGAWEKLCFCDILERNFLKLPGFLSGSSTVQFSISLKLELALDQQLLLDLLLAAALSVNSLLQLISLAWFKLAAVTHPTV